MIWFYHVFYSVNIKVICFKNMMTIFILYVAAHEGAPGRCPVGIPFSHTHCNCPPQASFALSLNVITVKSARCFIGFLEAQQFFQALVLCDPTALSSSPSGTFLGSPLYNWLKLQTSLVPSSSKNQNTQMSSVHCSLFIYLPLTVCGEAAYFLSLQCSSPV